MTTGTLTPLRSSFKDGNVHDIALGNSAQPRVNDHGTFLEKVSLFFANLWEHRWDVVIASASFIGAAITLVVGYFVLVDEEYDRNTRRPSRWY